MIVLKQILFCFFKYFAFFLGIVFCLAFLISTYSAYATWFTYKETKKDERGIFSLIKDSFTIFFWALSFSLYAAISFPMTICSCFSECLVFLIEKSVYNLKRVFRKS